MLVFARRQCNGSRLGCANHSMFSKTRVSFTICIHMICVERQYVGIVCMNCTMNDKHRGRYSTSSYESLCGSISSTHAIGLRGLCNGGFSAHPCLQAACSQMPKAAQWTSPAGIRFCTSLKKHAELSSTSQVQLRWRRGSGKTETVNISVKQASATILILSCRCNGVITHARRGALAAAHYGLF